MLPSQNINNSEQNGVHLCQQCDFAFSYNKADISPNAPIACPQCSDKDIPKEEFALSGNLALALACLILFVPSHFYPVISIRLFGVMIPTSISSSLSPLMDEGFFLMGVLVLIFSSIVPLLLTISVITAHFSLHNKLYKPFRFSLTAIEKLKDWLMLDVFLLSLAVSSFQLQDYADIHVSTGLLGLVLLHVFSYILAGRININAYLALWHSHSKNSTDDFSKLRPNPDQELTPQQRSNSIQKTWALLITATVSFIPANILPISILINNGVEQEDTIFSGVLSLIESEMSGIAIIIFAASIIVPAIKILGLAFLLIAIQLEKFSFYKQKIMTYRMIHWIGKWSITDVFVIAIMITLLDRGQLLDYTPGYGAVFFCIVVICSMLAAISFEPKLLLSPNKKKD